MPQGTQKTQNLYLFFTAISLQVFPKFACVFDVHAYFPLFSFHSSRIEEVKQSMLDKKR